MSQTHHFHLSVFVGIGSQHTHVLVISRNHILDNQAEALEFAIRENSPVTGIPLSELNLKKNLLVGYLNRNGQVKIPRGQDTIQVGDTVIIVTSQKGLRDITDILEK